jgi:hypothetical protein
MLSGEKKRRREYKKLDPADIRISWYRLPTKNWRSKLDPISYFYLNGGCSGYNAYYLTVKEFTHHFTIIITSTGIFGIGLGQIIYKIFGG